MYFQFRLSKFLQYSNDLLVETKTHFWLKKEQNWLVSLTIFFHCATILFEYSNDLPVYGLAFGNIHIYQLSLLSREVIFWIWVVIAPVPSHYLLLVPANLGNVGIFQ